MPDRLNIALAQLNPVLGDIPGNLARARAARSRRQAHSTATRSATPPRVAPVPVSTRSAPPGADMPVQKVC